MNNGPIFHLPHSPGLFDACQGLVTRLDEENNLEEVGRDRELKSVNDSKRIREEVRVEGWNGGLKGRHAGL